MLHFPPLRTRRLDVSLRELSINDAIELALLDPNAHEAAASRMLPMIVAEARGAHSNPGLWTVQERMLVVAHYFGVTCDDMNFSAGGGRYFDYLDAEADYPRDESEPLQAIGHTWRVRHLLGAEAEMLEALCVKRRDWILGDMAARLVRGDLDPRPDAAAAPGLYAEWLKQRMREFGTLAGSDFAALFMVCREGSQQLQHLFRVGFDEHGHIVLAKEAGDGGSAHAPTRFPVAECVPELARELCQ